MSQLTLPNPQSYIEPDRTRNQTRLLDLYFNLRRKCRNRFRFCWAGNESLAKDLGCSVDTVTRIVARLESWGVITVEQVIGIQRRIRVIMAPEKLKAMLFRGHISNRRSSFCSKNAVGSAEPVAEGHNREGTKYPPLDLPYGEKTTNRGVGVVVSTPSAPSLNPEALVALLAIGVPELQAVKMAQGQPLERIRQAAQAVKAYLQKKSGNVVALAWTAVKEGWEPPAPTSSHSSDRGERRVDYKQAPKPKQSIPADWIPGAPEADVRGCANKAVEQLRAEGQWPVETGAALQIPELAARLRDRVRAIWRELHPGQPAPWDSASTFSLGRPSGPLKKAVK